MSGLILIGCQEEKTANLEPVIRPVKLIEVNSLVEASKRIFPARIEANQKADLAFRISGELVTLPLLEGQSVLKDELLAKLDDRDSKNNLLLREADYELAQADFRRKAELLKKKLISNSDYDISQANLKTAKANLASAQDQLSYTKLLAPFNGVVAQRGIDNYQTVQAGQTILTLQRRDVVDVVIQVPESFLLELKSMQASGIDLQPSVVFPFSPQSTFPVEFKESATQVSSGTQSYKTAFTLTQPKDFEVLPGMSAELIIDFAANDQPFSPVVIPSTAIEVSDNSGKNIIWVFDEKTGTVNSRPVSLGNVRSNGIEVLSGLMLGDSIVATGIQHLREGMMVKPLTWERGI